MLSFDSWHLFLIHAVLLAYGLLRSVHRRWRDPWRPPLWPRRRPFWQIHVRALCSVLRVAAVLCAMLGFTHDANTHSRYNNRVVVTAALAHTAAFYLIYANFLGVPWISLWVGLLCSFLLGLGDSAVNTAVRFMFYGFSVFSFYWLTGLESGSCTRSCRTTSRPRARRRLRCSSSSRAPRRELRFSTPTTSRSSTSSSSTCVRVNLLSLY